MRKLQTLAFVGAAIFATAAFTGTALASDIGAGSANTESTMACSGPTPIRTSGGYAQYTECKSGGYVKVRGYVEDTDADGQCAQVYADYSSGLTRDYSPRACPKGDRDNFEFPSRRADDAYVYLREI